jgi:hypothetical protein
MVTKVITVEYEKKIQKRFNGSHETYIKKQSHQHRYASLLAALFS